MPSLAKQYLVDRAIGEAASVLETIDTRWPAEGVNDKSSKV